MIFQRYILFIVLSLYSLEAAYAQTDQTPWYQSLSDSCQGIQLVAAREFIQEKRLRPRRQVIVGVVDSGVDTLLTDLQGVLWTNPKERRDGKDNDHNGYVDDIHGWNFLGTADGKFNMVSAGTEEFREFKRLYPKYKGVDRSQASDKKEFDYFKRMEKAAGIGKYLKYAQYMEMKHQAYKLIDSIARKQFKDNTDTLTLMGFATVETEDPAFERSFQTITSDLLHAGRSATWSTIKANHEKALALVRKRVASIESDPDKRLLIGDDLEDNTDRHYGNHILQVEGYDHGTFVATIIAGQGHTKQGITGVDPNAKVMIIRAVPNGDEYDKDVSSSIYYAVDNGARVINLSLGKYTSPHASMVTKALLYAKEKDVLVIQAAGNHHRDIDSVTYYPLSTAGPERLDNFLRVGASDKEGRPVSFSNYGPKEVDLFAPGIDIAGVMPGNEVTTSDGSSVAAPIVSGIAAIIRSYFPKLKAKEVKDILIRSCRPQPELKTRCKSGGVVDALAALKLAYGYHKKQ